MRIILCAVLLMASVACTSDVGTIPITIHSDAARALYVRARALNENLQVHEAHALFTQAALLDSTSAVIAYQLASTAPTEKERSAHLARAMTLADRASAGERLLIHALHARRNGAPTMARQYAESLVMQYPKDARAHWLLGNSHLVQQQYEPAIREFRQAIAIDSGFSLAYNQVGYAYRGAERMAEAETAFRRYIALVPNDPNPYDSYAELLLKLGRFDESIAQYEKALTIDPHFAGSFVGIASAQVLAGRYAEAVAAADRYERSARDDYERRTALLTRAQVHVSEGATENAVSAMEQRYAIAAEAGDTLSMTSDAIAIADILLHAGRPDRAAQRYEAAHTLLAASSAAADAKQDDALGSLYHQARVALARGDRTTAQQKAAAYAAGAQARGHDARLRESRTLLGLIALSAGAFDESVRELEQADQHDPAVWWMRARAEEGRGDLAAAESARAKAWGMNSLITFSYAFTRREIDATRSATSRTARGTRH